MNKSSYFSTGGGESDDEDDRSVAGSDSDADASDKSSVTEGEGIDEDEVGEVGEDEEVDEDEVGTVDENDEREEDEDEAVSVDEDASVDEDEDDENHYSTETQRASSAGYESEEETDAQKFARKLNEKMVPRKATPDVPSINAMLDETVDDSEDDEDDDTDEKYLQKFNSDLNKSYIQDSHPECIIQNYHEIIALSVVIRDKTNVIVDDLHRTCPYMTKYEKTRIVGQRAKQINAGAPAFVKVPEKIIDGFLIAEMELVQKKVPFIIRRPLPNGGSEYWKISDLEDVSF